MSASTAINRIVDIFEGRQQQQIRTQLAHTLQATISQTLFKDQSREGRIPACEILVCTGAVRRCIRDNETHLIPGMIETGTSSGMQTMDQAIVHWVAQNRVAPIDALPRLQSPKAIELVSARQRAARHAVAPSPAHAARPLALAGRK
jgi:twitching motility protein PilT